MSSGHRRKRPRPSYSCMECTRRKLRCSKQIPCSACVERGVAQYCRRRTGSSVSEARDPSPVFGASSTRRIPDDRGTPSVIPCSDAINNLSPASHSSPVRTQQGNITTSPMNPDTIDVHCAVPMLQESRPRRRVVDNVNEDAAVMLEFLALSRQRVSQIAQIDQTHIRGQSSILTEAYELLFTLKQVRTMMAYHQDCISWIHNVVHLPTFRDQCESLFADPTKVQPCWLALYYAMLAVTLYHADPGILQEIDIPSSTQMSELCYQKSLDSLHRADFMINHNILSIQAICLLIYVGHNLGQSDRISVLLASAVRIAQCLCLHRLGSTSGEGADEAQRTQSARQQWLIDREVSKRVWWFLVRQDWLQIPFNNTYTIHPTQFNTPMPANCEEDVDLMFSTAGIIEHDQEHFTQGSYTMVLNHVAVLIWKTQDKMCQQGHPNKVDDGLRKLYTEVIQADRDLRELMNKMPSFFRGPTTSSSMQEVHIKFQREVLFLALAHKFYSVHRHFQIPSFKDPWFAYTKVSCLPIIRRSLATIVSSPEEPYFYIVRSMWTVNTQVLTAAEEIRALALKTSRFLQINQTKSRIAKRGFVLINTLLDLDRRIESGDREHFNIKDIVSQVEGNDDHPTAAPADLHCDAVNSGSIVDWLARDITTWESIVGALEGV
ncbi:putative C6 transcription factor [Aspergillus japonicus CBS 114.51]|uniref:Putative C6 transcription factor n=1 Tax=Aspergillus japonicus CBS 114.51 TaxID=1448312 RepID=A0A8T8WJL3_ASPJA|nr:putative C6 transcription factor [Aspergillus japonicus CBS 114.51]RAH75893.1 putative C6 transcription factor [Aspergillus japonicus CBS 114.51]